VLNPLGGAWPLGTFAVNLVGCLAFGCIAQLGIDGRVVSRETALVLTAGFLGGLTTFSSFGFETFQLLDRRALVLAAAYAGLSVASGIAAVWLGMRLAR
jgi:fluoride exporter